MSTRLALALLSTLLAACTLSSTEHDSTSHTTSDSPSASSEPREASLSTPPAASALPGGVLQLPEPNSGEETVVLDAGRYQVPINDTVAYEIDLPQGTYVHGGKYLAFAEARPRPIAGILYADDAGADVGVPRDPCKSHENIAPAGTTVDDLVTAIRNQPILEVTEPVPTELGGARGQYLEVRIPENYDATSCADGELGLVGSPGMVRNVLPGYVGTWWILDVDGERIVIQPYCPGPCPDNSTERLKDVAETITFTRLR